MTRGDRTEEPTCRHQTVLGYSAPDGSLGVWACADCDVRFYPACPTCVSVGHRGITHPVEPLPPAHLSLMGPR